MCCHLLNTITFWQVHIVSQFIIVSYHKSSSRKGANSILSNIAPQIEYVICFIYTSINNRTAQRSHRDRIYMCKPVDQLVYTYYACTYYYQISFLLKSWNLVPVFVSIIAFDIYITCVAGFVPFGSPIVSNQFDWQYLLWIYLSKHFRKLLHFYSCRLKPAFSYLHTRECHSALNYTLFLILCIYTRGSATVEGPAILANL